MPMHDTSLSLLYLAVGGMHVHVHATTYAYWLLALFSSDCGAGGTRQLCAHFGSSQRKKRCIIYDFNSLIVH
jgi:hypothetical protein